MAPRARDDGLTRREAEVLDAVERRLTNPEIAAELYVSVRTIESHVAALRRKLGVDTRATLIEAAHARRGTVVQLPQNSFVGRDDDVAIVRALLAGHRWVTVVGPAGCGKTRLALEVAAGDDRVPVVAELAGATPGTAGVAGTVARAVGVGTDARDALAACGVALAAQPYLLVLDNCDRVTAEVGEAVGRLLTLAPTLTVLATSRAPVGGPDEAVVPLTPLASASVVAGDGAGAAGGGAGAAGGGAGAGGGGEPAAVRLFLDRARTAAPTRPLGADDLDLVAEVCERLDGLPLAIELAAARVRHLPMPELAARLAGGLDLLAATPGPGAAGRHATLDAALAWTWDLLDDDERTTLSRLAALPLDSDLEVAAAVCGPDAGRIVLRLLDRSLLAQTPTVTDPRRFRLLHPVREFVLGRTEEALAEDARRAHAVHHAEAMAALAARSEREDGPDLTATARRVTPDAAAALRWATRADPGLAVALARSLSVVAERCGPQLDSLDALAGAARDPAVLEAAGAPDLYELGIALCFGDLDLVADLAAVASAKAAAAGAGDLRARVAAAHLAGEADAYRHEPLSAVAHLGEAARLAAELGDYPHVGAIHQARGIALRDHGNAPGAMSAFEAAIAAYAEAGDPMHVNNTRYMMASTAAATGHRASEAAAWATECASYARATGNHHELAHATLAGAGLSPGTTPPAVLHGAAAAFRAAGDLRCLTRTYLLLAGRVPVGDRPPLLDQALAVATTAHDSANQAAALAGLVAAHWEAGDGHAAHVALGTLVALAGEDEARARTPAALHPPAPEWLPALAEGRARAARLT